MNDDDFDGVVVKCEYQNAEKCSCYVIYERKAT